MPCNSFHAQWNFRLLLIFLLLFAGIASAQYTLTESSLPKAVSLYEYAMLADAGDESYSIEEIVSGDAALKYSRLTGENTNIGFTDNHYWLKVSLRNATSEGLDYYLETGRPVTDIVDLYTVDQSGSVKVFHSGDKIPFSERAFGHRKAIFNLDIEAGEQLDLFIHYKSDGEVLNIPVSIQTPSAFVRQSIAEQLFFGVFYGILSIAAIIYLFFYVGLKEKSFLYYSMYVTFIGLMQFSLDGYFYQFMTPSAGYISNRAVILFACLSTFFLGKYAEEFLGIRRYSRIISRSFMLVYFSAALLFVVVLFIPGAIVYSYPIANVLGLAVLMLIVASVVTLYIKTNKIDYFFTIGISCLILGFIIFILNNFSVLPNTFFTENSSKFGTGLEVIFLSLSMANLIRLIKNEREQFNALALVRSEEMNDLKSYFLSNISHELRTPLNAIVNLTDSVSGKSTEPDIKLECDTIKYATHTLLRSVNDILDFSKIDKNELVLENADFDPAKVLEQLKNIASVSAVQAGLEFEYVLNLDIPCRFHGDVMRFEQIVTNLLNNAIKFTPAGKVSMSVSGRLHNSDQHLIEITISDTGIGIPPEKMDSIFGSFTQDRIDNKRKYGGLGLGLFIVKALVDLKGGTVTCDTVPGKGTSLKVTLPYKTVLVSDTSAALAETGAFSDTVRILVVEDNAINQLVIKTITKKWTNAETVYANNGQEALDALNSQKFEVILMDLQMPVMDGYEATIAIRQGRAGTDNADIPIIAVTADVMEETKKRVSDIGMNAYLSKPIKNESLFDTIRPWVKEKL